MYLHVFTLTAFGKCQYHFPFANICEYKLCRNNICKAQFFLLKFLKKTLWPYQYQEKLNMNFRTIQYISKRRLVKVSFYFLSSKYNFMTQGRWCQT